MSVTAPVSLGSQHLRTFLAVVDANGRLSAAAQRIGMSQPGVTHQLNEMERRLGVRLLDRHRGRPARLTRAGRAVERHARDIVHLHNSLDTELEFMREHVTGQLRVAASPGPGEHWLPPLLCGFASEHPDVNLEMHVSDARSIVESVFDQQFEVGFVGGRWSRSGLTFDPIYHDEVILIVSPESKLLAKSKTKAIDLADLYGMPFIAQEPGGGLRVDLERELTARGASLSHFNVIAELGNQESVKSAVAAGHGIGCVLRGSAALEIASGTVAVLNIADFQPDGTYYIVRRANHVLSMSCTALIDHVRTGSEELPTPLA